MVTSIWPGADAFLAEPKVRAEPKISPLIRLMAPSFPMDMVMIGSSGYWAFTASVADSKVRTSLADVGIQASFATSAPSFFIPVKRHYEGIVVLMSVPEGTVLFSILVAKSYHIYVISNVAGGVWLMPILLREW